ncbi:periplasmic chaperone for outer membrane proteins Skp [Cetobacterium ceti]|uniref:Periplasmic chaperone for outer membrane proteins Skp n=1 Tax=Cetobacterium ceti TaxID=180163 RepID=A0A1T4JY60_9FUSO|nr:OmpH family outer membrane protein [Cetobacterium ceti]SJZ34955.1 periplasmic chaperone for outer membrane proteins Skp [Cetobacterium ceti]
MKKISMLLLGLTVASSAFAMKVGYVNSQELFSNYTQTKIIQNNLNKQKSRLENEIKEKEVNLQKLQVELQAKGAQATEAQKKAFQNKVDEFQKLVRDSQTKLNREEMSRLQEIDRIMNGAIQNVAKKGGYEYVFEQGAMKFGGDNLTPKVLQVMEQTKKLK